jgi:hypothetical protein
MKHFFLVLQESWVSIVGLQQILTSFCGAVYVERCHSWKQLDNDVAW